MTRHLHPNDPTYSTKILNDWVRLQRRRQVRRLPEMDMDRRTLAGILESGLRELFGTEYEKYEGKK